MVSSLFRPGETPQYPARALAAKFEKSFFCPETQLAGHSESTGEEEEEEERGHS